MKWWEQWFRTKEKAAFIRAYEEKCSRTTHSSHPLEQLSFVILDTETTGLNPKKDYILSFGAVKLRNYSIKMSSGIELYPNSPSQTTDAVQIHEILLPKEVTSLRSFAEQVLAYIGNDTLVGHHVAFDLAMLTKAMAPFGFSRFLNPVVDTAQLAIRLERGPGYNYSMEKPGEFSLDNLCIRYGIPLDDRHTAAGDALLTAQLLMKLLKKAEEKGIRNYGSLIR
jgi:DNA polymerase III subunit epsilon